MMVITSEELARRCGIVNREHEESSGSEAAAGSAGAGVEMRRMLLY